DCPLMKVDGSEVTFPQSYRAKGWVYPDPKLVRQLTDILRTAERPLIMAGSAIYWSDASEELRQFAELARAPVYLTVMGRGSLHQDHELFYNRSRRGALGKADALVVLGRAVGSRLSNGNRFQ